IVGPGRLRLSAVPLGLVAGSPADAIDAAHRMMSTNDFRMPAIILASHQSKGARSMLLAEFSIWPMDKGESVSEYVARAIDIVDRSGLPYKLGPLVTCLEGEWSDV